MNWLNPYTNAVENEIWSRWRDHGRDEDAHMVTADPFRTPTFTPFADPDWFFFATGGATPAACQPPTRVRSDVDAAEFAWNHGDIQGEIA